MSGDGFQPKVSEENGRSSIDIFLKVAGYLDCAVRHILPQLPPELRDLPVDLAEGVLHALCLQALGQSVDIQLGLATDSTKAILAVKRRLACEMGKYWQQALAQDNITNIPLTNGWGEKHKLFVKWKYIKTRDAAYYCHGLILDEGNTEKLHGMVVAALQVADEYLKESKKTCEAFNMAPPLSRDYLFRSKPDVLRYLETEGINSCKIKPKKRDVNDLMSGENISINLLLLRFCMINLNVSLSSVS